LDRIPLEAISGNDKMKRKMKKLLLFIPTFIFLANLMAQDTPNTKQGYSGNPKYCAMMKDGKMSLSKDGKMVSSDVSLQNGVKLTHDGTLVKRDGTRRMLKNGECVDFMGNISDARMDKGIAPIDMKEDSVMETK
jgi:hypothetical protein